LRLLQAAMFLLIRSPQFRLLFHRFPALLPFLTVDQMIQPALTLPSRLPPSLMVVHFQDLFYFLPVKVSAHLRFLLPPLFPQSLPLRQLKALVLSSPRCAASLRSSLLPEQRSALFPAAPAIMPEAGLREFSCTFGFFFFSPFSLLKMVFLSALCQP